MRPTIIALLALISSACVDPCEDPEVPYDGIDNDCGIGTPDDDLDGDGFALVDDCDDEDPAVNPDAIEVCNGIDDNCTGGPLTPPDINAVDCVVYWRSDWDGDGFGNPATEMCECDVPADAVDNGDDCNDSNPGIFPDSWYEVDGDCDGVDHDCDPSWPENEADSDGDGWTECAGDCRPNGAGAADVYPGAPEICDFGLDNDCNPQTPPIENTPGACP